MFGIFKDKDLSCVVTKWYNEIPEYDICRVALTSVKDKTLEVNLYNSIEDNVDVFLINTFGTDRNVHDITVTRLN